MLTGLEAQIPISGYLCCSAFAGGLLVDDRRASKRNHITREEARGIQGPDLLFL